MSERTIEEAKAIVAKAIEFHAWTWDDLAQAENPDEVRSTAEQLVRAAVTASERGLIADAVLEILHVSGQAPQSDSTRAAYAARFGESAPQAAANGQPAAASSGTSAFGAPSVSAQDASAMAKASAPETSQSSALGEPADSPAPAAGELPSIDDVFPGYDDMKVKDIKAAVLASAASGDLSEEEWTRIRAYEAANEERKTILSLQPEFKQPEPEPAPTTFAQPTTHKPEQFDPRSTDDATESLEAVYQGEAISRAQQESLPIPSRVDTSQHPPVLPIDITNVSDQELSRIATQYHSCYAFAEWLRSQEEGRERAAEQLEQDAHRDAFTQALVNHESAIPEDKRTASAVENARRSAGHDADSSGPVKTWRTRKVRHGIEVRELKALANGYDKAVWRINEELDRRARLSTTSRAAS